MTFARTLRQFAAVACICLLCVVILNDGALADEQVGPDGKPVPGHSSHGDAFDEGPRQAAYLMGKTGKVSFPITTKNPEGQKFFNQGIGQLHGFWYFEAERSFRQVAALDPECAIAYWGMAMANGGNEKRAKEFIKEAVKRKQQASVREAMWIDGLNEYYHGTEKDEAQRRRKHITSLEAIVHDFPDDIEAKAFLAWRIWDSRQKVPMNSAQAVDAIIEQVLKAEPMHPAHHYRIHLWDDSKPVRAVTSAARAGQSSPSIAHMWHMPGHTYSKLQRYEDAVFHQEASARVDHAHMIRDRVLPYQIHNYAHNNEWCVRNLSFVGRVRDAIDLSINLIELPRHPKFNTPERNGSAAAMGRDRLFDLLSLHEMWDEYIRLADAGYLTSDNETPEQKVRRLRYLGVAFAAKGKKDEAAKQIAALETLKKEQAAKPASRPATAPAAPSTVAEAKPATPATRPATAPAAPTAVAEAKPATRPSGPGGGRFSRGGSSGNISASIDKAISHIRGQQAAAKGDHKEALSQFEKAGDLRKEHMARAQLAAGNKDRAEQLAREAVTSGKGQCYPLATQINILFKSGKTDEAKKAFEQLRKLSSRIDLGTAPVYAALKPIAKKFGYPADWRLARTMPDDILPRPEFDTLGPFRWHPTAAPDWSLLTADRKKVSLSSYRGKPVLVVFYLGYGCLHCIEQLNTLAPMTEDFKKAGISIVAISADSVSGLSKSLETAKIDGGYPFPLVSDEELKAFKAYRAYDDFEQSALHGLFLIDGQGLIRWQDISYQPFTDAKFLLGESKRLLAQQAEHAAQ